MTLKWILISRVWIFGSSRPFGLIYLNPSLVDSSSNWSTSRACLSWRSRIRSWRSWRNWELSSSIFCPRSARRTLTRSSSSLRSRARWLSAAILDLLWYAVRISSSLCSLSDSWLASCSCDSSSLIYSQTFYSLQCLQFIVKLLRRLTLESFSPPPPPTTRNFFSASSGQNELGKKF